LYALARDVQVADFSLGMDEMSPLHYGIGWNRLEYAGIGWNRLA